MNIIKRYPTALTVAGSDSGGCAGIQADIKTFSAIGVFGASVITAVTAQNTREVRAVEVLSPKIIRQQLEAVLDDITVDAVKTGVLPSPECIETLAEVLERYSIKTLIVDPVMVTTSGAHLAPAAIADSFRRELYRRATLLTPNRSEAEVLSGIKIQTPNEVRKAAEILLNQGCRAVLIKGGHFSSECSVDTLFQYDKEPVSYSSPFIDSKNLHGTGCTLSSAIVAYMALKMNLETAVKQAKEYISTAISQGKNVTTGQGHGPVNHFFNPNKLIVIEN